jgi:hypothetical protein
MARLFAIDHHKVEFRCPTLVATGTAVRLQPSNIDGIVNAQHHCKSSGCIEKTSGVQYQERKASKARTIIDHHDDGRYILNIFCLKSQTLLDAIAHPRPTQELNINAAIREAKIPEKAAKQHGGSHSLPGK